VANDRDGFAGMGAGDLLEGGGHAVENVPACQRRSLIETRHGHREGTALPGPSTGLKHCPVPLTRH